MKLSLRFFYLRAVWGNTFLIRMWQKELDELQLSTNFARIGTLMHHIVELEKDRKFFWQQIFAKEPV